MMRSRPALTCLYIKRRRHELADMFTFGNRATVEYRRPCKCEFMTALESINNGLKCFSREVSYFGS